MIHILWWRKGLGDEATAAGLGGLGDFSTKIGTHTPPKTNMEPAKWRFGRWFDLFKSGDVQVPAVSFRECRDVGRKNWENCEKCQHPFQWIWSLIWLIMLRTKPKLECFVSLGTPGPGMPLETLQSLWSFHSVTLMDNIKHHKVLLTTWFFGPTLQQSFTLIFFGKIIHPRWTCRMLARLRQQT